MSFPTYSDLVGHNFDNVDGAGLTHRHWMGNVGDTLDNGPISLSASSQVRAVLAADGSGLTLTDALGTARVKISDDNDDGANGDGIRLYDAAGNLRARIRDSLQTGDAINLYDAANQERFTLRDDGSGLTLTDASGNTKVVLPDHGPLLMNDAGPALALEFDPDNRHLAIYDEDGTTLLAQIAGAGHFGELSAVDTDGHYATLGAGGEGLVIGTFADGNRVALKDDGSGLTLTNAMGTPVVTITDTPYAGDPTDLADIAACLIALGVFVDNT